MSRYRAAERARLFTDGSSRGNPGPSGFGVVLFTSAGERLERKGALGTRTCNQAEYLGLIEGLSLCAELGEQIVSVFMDSTLVVQQMTGSWRVRESGELSALHERAKGIEALLMDVQYAHVPRTQNREADRLAQAASGANRSGRKPAKDSVVVAVRAGEMDLTNMLAQAALDFIEAADPPASYRAGEVSVADDLRRTRWYRRRARLEQLAREAFRADVGG